MLGVGVGGCEGTVEARIVKSPITVEGDGQLLDALGGDDRDAGATVSGRPEYRKEGRKQSVRQQ